MTEVVDRFQQLSPIYVCRIGRVQAAVDAQSGMKVALVRVPVALTPKLEVARDALVRLHGLASGPPPGAPQVQSDIMEDECGAVMAIGPLQGASTFDQTAISELHLLELARQHLTIQIALADAGFHGYAPGAEMVWSQAEPQTSTFLGWEALAIAKVPQRVDLREAAQLWYFWATRLPVFDEIDVDTELASWQRLSLGFREICEDAWHNRVPAARLLTTIEDLRTFHSQPSEKWVAQVAAGTLSARQVRVLCDLAERQKLPEDQQQLLIDSLSALADGKVRHWRQEGDRLLRLGRYSEAAKVFEQLANSEAPSALRLVAWRRLYCARGLVELIEERALRLDETPIHKLETDLFAALHLGDEQQWSEAHDQIKAWRANLPKSVTLPSVAALEADYTFHQLWQGSGELQADQQTLKAKQLLTKARKQLKAVPYHDTIIEVVGDIELRAQEIELDLARQRAVNEQIEKAKSEIDAGDAAEALHHIRLGLQAMPQHSPSFDEAARVAGDCTRLWLASKAGLGQPPEKLPPARRVQALGHLLQLMLQKLDSQWLSKQWDVWQVYCEAMPAAQPEAELLGLLNDYQHLLPQVKRLVERLPAGDIAQPQTANAAPGSDSVAALPQSTQGGVAAPNPQPGVKTTSPVAAATVDHRDVLKLAYDAGRLPKKDLGRENPTYIMIVLQHTLEGNQQAADQAIAALECGHELSRRAKEWIKRVKDVWDT